MIDPKTLWFNTPDTATLCRGGGNGHQHPSQLFAIRKFVKKGMSFLDYGCGSGTTLEAMIEAKISNTLNYRGLDIIPKNIEWCQEHFKGFNFKVNRYIHKIDEPDKSWDVVYSRHVVDHMKSFEKAMDEHMRVARKLVIVVLWRPLLDGDKHQIKNIIDHKGLPEEIVYKDEYTNDYSKEKVLKYLKGKDYKMFEGVGKEVRGFDTVIVIKL